jgi:predicted PurR-regulated permease PerM
VAPVADVTAAGLASRWAVVGCGPPLGAGREPSVDERTPEPVPDPVPADAATSGSTAAEDNGASAAARVVGAGTAPDGERRRRRRLPARGTPPVSIALGVAGGLLLAQLVTTVGGRLRGLLSILVISLFLSFAMEPAVQWLARRGMLRGFGTWFVFLGVLLAFGGMIAAMVPLVAEQVRNLIDAGPTLLDDLASRAESLPGELGPSAAAWLNEQAAELPRQLPRIAGDVGRGALGIGQTVLGVVFQALTIALIVFYLVADGPKLRAQLARRLPPREQVRVLGLWELAVNKTGGYVYSRLLTAIVSTVFHAIVFTVLGLDYAAALAVWVGVISSVIPAVGTYIAGTLPIVVALADSLGLAVAVLVAIVLYQQVENYLVVPRITATTLELHPAVAFVSVVAGAAVGGAPGALLALPAVAIVAALLAASGEEYGVLEHELLETRQEAAEKLIADAAAQPEDRWDTDRRRGPTSPD